jgi:hypothetical protein
MKKVRQSRRLKPGQKTLDGYVTPRKAAHCCAERRFIRGNYVGLAGSAFEDPFASRRSWLANSVPRDQPGAFGNCDETQAGIPRSPRRPSDFGSPAWGSAASVSDLTADRANCFGLLCLSHCGRCARQVRPVHCCAPSPLPAIQFCIYLEKELDRKKCICVRNKSSPVPRHSRRHLRPVPAVSRIRAKTRRTWSRNASGVSLVKSVPKWPAPCRGSEAGNTALAGFVTT